MFKWLRKKIANSPSTVVVGPGVLKTHNVECRFRDDNAARYGKLCQDRWSDGQERFSLVLRSLPVGDDPAQLYKGDELVSGFDRTGNKLNFRWKGMSSESIPKFDIGDVLRIEVGGLAIAGTVEAD